MRKLKAALCLLLPGLALLPGCAWLHATDYFTYPDNPFPQLRTVAVVPFVLPAQPESKDPTMDSVAVADLFASELVQVGNLGKVIRPAEVQAYLRKEGLAITTVQDVIQLARGLKVDSVILGAVTEYDPYYPPRVGLAVQFFATHQVQRSHAVDVDKLLHAGHYKIVQVSPSESVHLLASLEEVYDSHRETTRWKIGGWELVHHGSDRAFVDEERILRVMPLYLRFASFDVILGMFEMARQTVRGLQT